MLTDVAVAIAAGARDMVDIEALRGRAVVFGPVASDTTVMRALGEIADALYLPRMPSGQVRRLREAPAAPGGQFVAMGHAKLGAVAGAFAREQLRLIDPDVTRVDRTLQ